MILWVILFFLVVAISFILAAMSMRDFQQIPSITQEYSLFLIRNTKALDKSVLDTLYNELSKSDLIISFERLIKGNKSALVVFGPTKLISSFKDSFDLLELEDYTNVDLEKISAWEVGVTNGAVESGKVFKSLPQLSDSEQFWWQLVLKVKKLDSKQTKSFQSQIRAVVVSEDGSKRKKVADTFLKDLKSENIFRIPKSFSDSQIIDFYKNRAFMKDKNNPILNLNEVYKLLTL